MANLDYNQILNATPQKRLLVGHDKLVENLNEASAQEYSKLYMDQPLSFLLENSRYIFSEPFVGYDYYVEQVLGNQHILECLPAYPEECEKVSAYLEEYGDKMSSKQREMYVALESKMQQRLKDTENSRVVQTYITENFSNDMDPKTTKHPMVYFLEAPYQLAEEGADRYEILSHLTPIVECCMYESSKETDWKLLFESIVTAGKLIHDPVYMEAVNTYGNRDMRNALSSLSMVSLSDTIRSINTIPETELPSYGSPELAVESVFDMADSYELFKEYYESERQKLDSLSGYAYGLVNGLLRTEYNVVEDPNKPVHGYQGLFSESTTIEDAFQKASVLFESYQPAEPVLEVAVGAPSQAIQDLTGNIKEDKLNRKKPEPPRVQGNNAVSRAARSIENRFMDKEAKSYKTKSVIQATGEDIKGAAKAVASIPSGIKESIDNMVASINEADERRRLEYISKPGYRKKIFRNLKLSLKYGAVASTNILMTPVLLYARHVSKSKDRRLRRQFIEELGTEIEICQAKIDDAASEGDKDAKYQLMRIKAKLEQERRRIIANSKIT